MNQTRSQTLLICFSKVRESEERLGRNDVMVKVAGDACYSFGLPLMQCILIKTFPGATGNKSVSNCNCVELFVRPKKRGKNNNLLAQGTVPLLLHNLIIKNSTHVTKVMN